MQNLDSFLTVSGSKKIVGPPAKPEGSVIFFRSFFTWETAADTKRTTVGDRRVLNSKCPKRVGSFGYSTDFLMRRLVWSDIDSVRKL